MKLHSYRSPAGTFTARPVQHGDEVACKISQQYNREAFGKTALGRICKYYCRIRMYSQALSKIAPGLATTYTAIPHNPYDWTGSRHTFSPIRSPPNLQARFSRSFHFCAACFVCGTLIAASSGSRGFFSGISVICSSFLTSTHP